MKIQGIVASGLTLLAAALASGCGGASAGNQVTQTQALAITSDLFAAMASAPLVPGGITQSVHAPDLAAQIRSAKPTGTETAAAAASPHAAQLAIPASAPISVVIPAFTYNCPSGGTIIVSGSFTGTDNETATPPTINISENLLETINHCNDNGTIINGNPSVAITGNVGLAGDIFTDVTTIAGGVTINNASCAINVTVSATLNDKTNAHSGTISGSVCGVSVNATL